MFTIPLSDNVPLRNSTVWGSYKNYRALPVGYGVVNMIPVQYDAAGTVFFVLDHPIAGVDLAWINSVPYSGFGWKNDLDATGKAVSFITLNRPLGEGETLSIRVRGKLHPLTGELITNPADILWDFLSDICRLPVQSSDLDAFRSECRNRGITASGLMADGRRTIRTVIDELMVSTGAIWSGGMPGYARIYP